MTDEQTTAQRLQMKANVQYLRMQVRAGHATLEQLRAAEVALEQLRSATPEQLRAADTPPPAPPTKKGEGWHEPVELSEEVAAMVAALRKQQDEIDYTKRSLSMQLQAVPRERTCPELTRQILTMREKWIAIGDEIRYVIAHGEQSSAPTEKEWDANAYASQLPNDRYALDKLIENLNINVKYKWPDRMRKAKTAAKKADYAKKIAKGEMELEVLKQHFKAIQP